MANEFMTIDNEILLDRRKNNVETAPPMTDENGGQINSRVSGKQLELVPTVSSGTRVCFLIQGSCGTKWRHLVNS